MRLRLRLFPACILLLSAYALAQLQEGVPDEAVNVRNATAVEYREHLTSLKALVEACKKKPVDCDSKKVGDDERVEGEGFQTRWSWLRDALSSAGTAAQPERD